MIKYGIRVDGKISEPEALAMFDEMVKETTERTGRVEVSRKHERRGSEWQFTLYLKDLDNG